MLELGASYAPWCVSAGLVADRLGFERIHLVAVEASRPAIDRIHDHVRLNGLADRGHVTWDILHAAVSFRGGQLYFPRVDTRSDNGAQATRRRARSDYRGMRLEYDKVPAVTLPELTRSLDHVDYIHLDLQGAEEALLEDDGFLNCLSKRASAMLLATQSRLIEGLALRALPARGWRLVRERPTMFQQNDRTDDPNGWTVRDGAQYWTRG
jgi:FkbM family methyltransferase